MSGWTYWNHVIVEDCARMIFQDPLPTFNKDAYNNSFHVSGTPGKHQWLQSWDRSAAISRSCQNI
nr:hypothetical protein [Tanacetum cinerariifolium]